MVISLSFLFIKKKIEEWFYTFKIILKKKKLNKFLDQPNL